MYSFSSLCTYVNLYSVYFTKRSINNITYVRLLSCKYSYVKCNVWVKQITQNITHLKFIVSIWVSACDVWDCQIQQKRTTILTLLRMFQRVILNKRCTINKTTLFISCIWHYILPVLVKLSQQYGFCPACMYTIKARQVSHWWRCSIFLLLKTKIHQHSPHSFLT